MEEENEIQESLALAIDDFGQQQLAYASRWAKFLAIVGMVVCGILVLAGIVFFLLPAPDFAPSTLRYRGYRRPGLSLGMMGCLYLIVATVHFFPALYLFQFAEKIKTALLSRDQDTLSVAFQKLKIMFRYSGIVIIVVVILYMLVFVFAIIRLALR